MPLIKKTGTTASAEAAKSAKPGDTVKGAGSAKFEEAGGGAEQSADTAETAAPAPAPAAPAAAPSASTAVAPVDKNALTAGMFNLADMNVIATLKDRLKLEWNTLDRIQATNGAFVDKGKADTSMGDEIQLRLLTWQDVWQVSPGSDDKEAKDHVRYCDNPNTLPDGTPVVEYLTRLREEFKYTKASCDHRVVLGGVLEAVSKDSRLLGELVQIDLPKTSKAEFDKYQAGTAYKVGKGLLKPYQAQVMSMTAEPVSANGRNWTIVRFAPTMDAEAS